MSFRPRTILERINDIEEKDLQYIETDLCLYQLVSLSFLLYGEFMNLWEFILQRIVILAKNPPKGKGIQNDGYLPTNEILSKYGKLNENWRFYIVEALAIIRAKKVLRKLGLPWQEIYQYFLPHVAEISVNIHPLLKVLYKVSERLTPDQAYRLITYVHDKHNDCKTLHFYDTLYLEVFFLNWLTKHVIAIGDRNLENCNIDILIEYLKFNDMDSIKDVLTETIKQQLNREQELGPEANNVNENETFMDSGISITSETSAVDVAAAVPTTAGSAADPTATASADTTTAAADGKNHHDSQDFDFAERYKISKERAGYVLIINQNKFYEETDPSLQHLLPNPSFKPTRNGTDVDRDKLKNLFSTYGYIPLIYNNLTHLEIVHYIREAVKKSLLKDSIIICILTHGKEGAVYGCNCIPVSINEIKQILTADILKGKPKLILLQACQKDDPKVDTTSTNAIHDFSPDAYADILLAVSAMKGTESLRDPTNGSWFIDSTYKFISKYGKSKHLSDIMTAVINDISKKRTEYEEDVMLPETSSTLRKDFFLPH